MVSDVIFVLHAMKVKSLGKFPWCVTNQFYRWLEVQSNLLSLRPDKSEGFNTCDCRVPYALKRTI